MDEDELSIYLTKLLEVFNDTELNTTINEQL